MKKKMKLRVTIKDPDCCSGGELRNFIECLRYAGFLSVIKFDPATPAARIKEAYAILKAQLDKMPS